MKITCQSCAAKYTIADEKVAGKTVKIKCKKCGATIVVNGAEVAYQPSASDPGYMQQAPPAEGGEEEEGDGQTTVFGPDGGPAGSPPGSDWTVNVADDDQRTMSSDAIAAAYASGTVTNDTYVWKDGMSDWSPLSGVPELMALVSRAAPAPAPAPAPRQPAAAASPAGGGVPARMDPAPTAAAAAAAAAMPTAARRSTNRPEKADPFQASEQAAAAAAPPAAKHDRNVGERNENSMLFSISALTAAKEARDNDRGPKNGGRSAVDDLMNLGAGAAPILAPPPLLAPVYEAPPPAPSAPTAMPSQGMAPAYGAQPMGGPTPMGGMSSMDDVYPRKKSPVGLILGIVGGLAVVGAVAAFFLTKSDDGAPTTPDQTAVTATTTPTSASPGVPSPTAPTDTGAAPSIAPPTDTGAVAPATPGGVAGQPGKFNPGSVPGGVGPTPVKTATPTPTAEPTPVKTAEPAAPPTEGAEFNRGAATSALGSAAGAAKNCKKPDGPTGSGRVKVTFAPSGNVTSAQVEGAPFAGTPVGGCVASAFRSAKVPPFSGPPVSVSKSFNIN